MLQWLLEAIAEFLFEGGCYLLGRLMVFILSFGRIRTSLFYDSAQPTLSRRYGRLYLSYNATALVGLATILSGLGVVALHTFLKDK